MDQFYRGADSLFVRAYDAFYGAERSQFAGDVAFYTALANDGAGPVLELACGTGRIALPLAEAGHRVTGLDLSEGMLAVARNKSQALPASIRDRLHLAEGDMASFELEARFASIIVAFRSFQHLRTIEQQRAALAAMRRHLTPGGRLALHLFDPRLEFLVEGSATPPPSEGVDVASGHRFVGRMTETRFDHLAQLRHDDWHYAEFDADGAQVAEAERRMVLRWTWRWELHHLLALSGFEVENEFSDFHGTPPAYGKELIVVARAR